MINRRRLAFTLAWALAGAALGHAKLVATVPAADAEVSAPRFLMLTFNEDVKLASLSVTVGGKPVAISVDRGAPAARRLSVTLPSLEAGIHRIEWTALSSNDGHVVKGGFSFRVR